MNSITADTRVLLSYLWIFLSLNFIFCDVLTLVQGASLLAGDNTLHYLFLSLAEITAALAVAGAAYRWKSDPLPGDKA